MRHLGGTVLALFVVASVALVACGARTSVLDVVEPGPDGGDASIAEGGDAGDGGDAEAGDASDAAGASDANDAADAGGEAEAGIVPLCMPMTCHDFGYSCGENGDGCGGTLQCGTCPVPQICGAAGYSECGGGYGLGPDGGPLCTPKSCQDLGFDCGPAADGCGGVLQCGTCQAPQVCGAAGNPGRCGSSCAGLCLQQVQCDAGATTSISGKIVTGTLPQYGSPDPVYDAIVYVPNGKVLPFLPGVACNQCGADVSGNPLVATKTAPDGTFVLQNMPAGTDIPLVVQLGRWRRQLTVPSVAPCTNTTLATDVTRLPRNQGEGDIPLTAIATGNADPIECVLMKMGVDEAEFTLPSGTGRVRIYESNGADIGPGTPAASTLWSSPSALATYDQVLLPCEGSELTKAPADQQDVIAYANAGGRVFTTHYGYTWLYDDVPFSGTASWNVNANYSATQTVVVDTSTQKGKDFSSWLADVGALSGPSQMSLTNTRYDVTSVNAPSEQFIYATTPQQQTLQYDFYTPVGQPMAQQCGRVIFSDFHVTNATAMNITFPAECPTGPLTSQEKALEFMIFDLGSCVPTPVSCVPRTCADQAIDCGPAGDGCGNPIDCGPCTAPDTCGGGSVYGQCGYPDAGSCTPETCAQLGYDCGVNGDGCGGTLDCGSCAPPQICGGGGKPSVCGP